MKEKKGVIYKGFWIELCPICGTMTYYRDWYSRWAICSKECHEQLAIELRNSDSDRRKP